MIHTSPSLYLSHILSPSPNRSTKELEAIPSIHSLQNTSLDTNYEEQIYSHSPNHSISHSLSLLSLAFSHPYFPSLPPFLPHSMDSLSSTHSHSSIHSTYSEDEHNADSSHSILHFISYILLHSHSSNESFYHHTTTHSISMDPSPYEHLNSAIHYFYTHFIHSLLYSPTTRFDTFYPIPFPIHSHTPCYDNTHIPSYSTSTHYNNSAIHSNMIYSIH